MESGRLEDESTASLCRRLAAESRTGCLHLTTTVDDEAREAHLWIREGRVITATAPEARARLGDRLVGGGHLTTEQLAHALEVHRDRPASARLGDVLVEEGLVSRATLRAVVREQIVDSVAAALGWTAGTWWFEEGAAVAADIPLGLGMQDTLMEAARRLGQMEVVTQHLGSRDAVVDFAATGGESRLSLRPDEWAMLTHIDGFNSVAEIAERSGYTEAETGRIIFGLLAAGVVVKVAGPGAGARRRELPARHAQATGSAAAADDTHLDLLEGLVSGDAPPARPVPPTPAAAPPAAPASPSAPDATAPDPTPPQPPASDPVPPQQPSRRRGGWSTPFRRR